MLLPLLLAQASDALSPANIGMLVLGLAFLSRWLWDYNKQKREDEGRVEPKSNPPLHERFVTATAHDKAITEIKAELTRHAGRRAEIYDTQKKQGAQLAALDAKTDLMNAQLQNQDGKIDRILERLPRK